MRIARAYGIVEYGRIPSVGHQQNIHAVRSDLFNGPEEIREFQRVGVR
jgi:hypothetical protein